MKVEATKFTEVGYVGRDVEQIARDLVEEAVRLERERRREAVREAASEAAMERLLDALVGKDASQATRESFRQRITENHMNDTEIEIDLVDTPNTPFEIPGMGGQVGMINLSDIMGKAMGQQPRKKRKLRVADAWDKLIEEESDKRLDPDDVNRVALKDAEANGIVFLDEIDKIAVSDVRGGSVSPRGRAARPAAADRGHDRRHEIRADEDRPYPVHRLGRVPRRQAVAICCRSCRAACRSGSS